MSLHALVSAAGHEKMMRQVSLDDMEGVFSTSIDFLIAFSRQYMEEWSAFTSEIGVSEDKISQAIESQLENDEPRAIRTVTPTKENGLTVSEAQELSSSQAPFSQPCHDAMRQSVREAKDVGELANPGRMMQILVSLPSAARSLFLNFVDTNTLDQASKHLVVRQVEAPAFDLDYFQSRTREMMDRMWPKIQEEINQRIPRINDRQEERFKQNPDYFLKRIDLAECLSQPIPDSNPLFAIHPFALRCGDCHRAAENEARIRKAPEVTLDHMFFSLLQDGLDTTRFFESKGVDWQTMRSKLDEMLPTYEDGPRWPPKARNLGMNTPSETVMEKFPHVSDFTQGQDSDDYKEALDQWSHRIDGITRSARPREFSDLLWVIPCFNEPKSLAYGLLMETDLTVEDVQAATDSTY